MPGELPPEGRIVSIVGQSGSGKSTLARRLIESRRRVFICEQSDAKSEYADALRLNSWAQVLDVMERLGPARHTADFCLSFSPGTTYFPHVCALLFMLGDVTGLFEELGKYIGPGITYPAPPTWDPIAKRMVRRRVPVPVEFINICERGRHAGPDARSPVSLINMTQRAIRQPTVARAESSRLYAFRQALDHDRSYIAGFPGCGPEIAERVKDLSRFNYLNIDSEGNVHHELTQP